MKYARVLFVIAMTIGFLCGCAVRQAPAASVGPSAPPVSAPRKTEAPAPTAAQSAKPPPPPSETVGPTPVPSPERYGAIPLPGEMRAMWISFLEWRELDLSTEESLRANVRRMFSDCAEMGLNTVIVAVHPFSDSMYESEYFPWSHLITGEQGKDPGYDPLAVMTEEAHGLGLRVEAWMNPYRVQHPEYGPSVLSEDSPAAANPSWVREQSGLWLDPGIPEVARLIIDCVTEIVENYDVDGIHFDDYFYPEGCTPDFDAQTYAQYGGGMELSEWRRANNNALVSGVYAAVKAANPSVSFGVSPQGNNGNNYSQQFCDIGLWLSEPGYADYIMPQLYWGFGYSRDGKTDAAFARKTEEWSAYPRHESVKLYAGLGAYRIGDGDGGDNGQEEWSGGRNLADMAAALRESQGFGGFALFHYGSLFPVAQSPPYPELAAGEVSALTALLRG